MKGFVMTAITNKGEKGIKRVMLTAFIKEKLCSDPLTVKFTFSRSQFVLQMTVKDKDFLFVLDQMCGSVIGKRDVDYLFEVLN